MKKIVEYDGTMAQLIAIKDQHQAEGFFLKEVMNIVTGNFLVFDDVPPEIRQYEDTAATIAEIKTTLSLIAERLENLGGVS